MGLPKFPLWLLLILSTANMSKCKSFSNYLAPNNIDGGNENCICFQKPEGYQIVPDILNNKNGNLERLVVYLYKDKSTDQVQLYIPNAEKQNLIPDLAFEEGDKLNSLENNSNVKDIFNLYLRPAPYYHNMLIANKPHAQDMPEYAGGNEAITIENVIPYIVSHELSDSTKLYENLIDNVNNHDSSLSNITPSETVNIPAKSLDIDGFDYHQNNVESNKVPTKTVDISNEGIYIDSVNYNKPSSSVLIPPEVNTPTEHLNDDSFANLPENYIYMNEIPTEEVDIPDKGNVINYVNYNNPNSIIVIPPKEVNTPAEIIDYDSLAYNEKHHLPENYVHNNKVPSIEVDINIDDNKYNKPSGISIMPFKEVTIPAESIDVDGFDYDEKHYWPDNNVEDNIPPLKEVDIPVVDNNDVYYHVPRPIYVLPSKKGRFYYSEVNDALNVLPHYYTKNIPKQSGTQTNKNIWNTYKQLKENYFTDITHNSAEKQGLKIDNEYETFDNWFIQQMQEFQTYTDHDRDIDIVKIEKHILKILHDNGMHVSDEGMLTDSFGTVLDVHNIHLRPILIGKSVAFGSILKEKPTDLVMPAHLPYLQAILVTQSNPSMILGIIPIGKTVIPPSTVKAFPSFVKPDYHIHTLLHKPKHHHTHLTNKPIRHTKGSAEFNMGYINGNKHKVLQLSAHVPVLVPKERKTIIPLAKETPAQKIESLWDGNDRIKSAEANNKFLASLKHVKEFLTSTPNLVKETVLKFDSLWDGNDGNDPLKSAEATNKLLALLRHGKGFLTSTPNYENVQEVEVNEVDIAERIIGGNAATSSGAPLSIKGRIKE